MKLILIIITLFLIMGSCSKKNEPVKPVNTIVGTWQEEETDVAFAGDTYHYIFDSDGGFKLKLFVYTDIIIPGNPCNNYYTYVTGTYSTTDSTIQLQGQYCDSTFAIMQPDHCSGQTTFSKWHLYYFQNGDLIFRISPYNSYKILMHRE